MIVGVSANLLSRRAASPDLGRRAFGVWAFAAIGSPVALARAATLPTVASLRFGPPSAAGSRWAGLCCWPGQVGLSCGRQHPAGAARLPGLDGQRQHAGRRAAARPARRAARQRHAVGAGGEFGARHGAAGAGGVLVGHRSGGRGHRERRAGPRRRRRLPAGRGPGGQERGAACRRTARQGGEEFVLVLPGATVRGALDTAQYIQESLAAAKLPHRRRPSARGSRAAWA